MNIANRSFAAYKAVFLFSKDKQSIGAFTFIVEHSRELLYGADLRRNLLLRTIEGSLT